MYQEEIERLDWEEFEWDCRLEDALNKTDIHYDRIPMENFYSIPYRIDNISGERT